MSIVQQDGFDHYGPGSDGRLKMLDGLYAQIASTSGGPYAPAIGARTGPYAMRVPAVSLYANGVTRRVLPSTYAELIFNFGYCTEQLPALNNAHCIMEARTAANALIARLYVRSNGALEVADSVDAVIATSGGPVLTAGAWQQINWRVKIGAGTGETECKVQGLGVFSATTLSIGATNIGQWAAACVGGAQDFFLDDLVINSVAGTYNNTFLGDMRVATLYPREDDEQGWTANRRHKFGNGIGQCDGAGDMFSCADNTMLELGAGDYTVESFVRFLSRPDAANRVQLFGKWREDNNSRSWRLFLGGASVNNGHLELEISTDGTAGTVASVCDAEFTPIDAHWYHICVQRSSNETVMFVDGVPLNAPAADASTYHDNSSLFTFGGQQNGSASVLAGTSLDGFFEEVRVTKGVARYNPTGFVPPSAAFSRNVGGDADFASVALLVGFDTSVTDESSFGRAITSVGNAARYAPDDADPGDYKTVNNATPRDDTGVEAPFTAAQSVLTFTGQPADGDTITMDGQTYTFQSPFVDAANNVALGATVSDTIDNLVAAANGAAGAGTLYGTGTTALVNSSGLNIDNDQMRLVANSPGTAGNAIAIAESCATASWQSGNVFLSGGLDIPGPSSFLLTRLPPLTTGVKALTLVQRALKTDAGDGTTQASFVTADNSSANGSAKALTVAATYYEDIVEEDPSTTNALAPASFVGSRLRIDRTA